MLPIVPIVIVVLRILQGRGGGGGVSLRGLAQAAGAILRTMVLGLVAPFPIIFALLPDRSPGIRVSAGAIAVCWMLLFFFPVQTIRVLTVRLGFPRATYRAARGVLAYSVSGHFRSGAAFLATTALRRAAMRRAMSPADVAWLIPRVDKSRDHGTNAATRVLLAHLSRHTDPGARDIASAYAAIGSRVHPSDAVREAHVLLTGYVLADAFAGGDLERVATYTFSFRSLTMKHWAARVFARCMIGAPMRMRSTQIALARFAAGRELRARLDPPTLARECSPSVSGNAIAIDERALTAEVTSLHASVLAAERPTLTDVARVLCAWDAFERSPYVAAQWERRKLALGAKRADLSELIDGARKAIGARVVAAGLHAAALPLDSRSCDAVRLQVKGILWERLSTVTARIRKRVTELDDLDAPEQWLEIGEAVRLWDRLAALASPVELYRAFNAPLDSFACFTCDKAVTKDRVLAYAMFRFLRERALAAGEAADVARLTRNMKVALNRG